MIIEELEKHHVTLEAVTETVDSSEVGKLISYIRGFASKLEAEKIKERTMRGKRARAREGKMSGGFHRTYGYDYVRTSEKNGGRRVINDTEAKWVKQMFEWLVNEGLSGNAITHRLRALQAPTKESLYWNRTSVLAILKNRAYAGKTYAFTGRYRRPAGEWIELPGATPAIISEDLFDTAQKQLQENRRMAKRNKKRQYLLTGHLYCRRCGRSYWGYVDRVNQRYRCPRTQRMVAPVNRCDNKSWGANKLDTLVWEQIERALANPQLILTELEKQRQDANQLGVFESQSQDVERQLKAIDREQHQLLQWALKGFPEGQVESENRRLNKSRETLKVQIAELDAQIKASQDAIISIPKLDSFIQRMQDRISALDFEGKRQVLDMLGVKVWVDGESVEITGVIPVEDDVIVTTHS